MRSPLQESGGRHRYVLAMLTAVYTLSLLDRGLMALLLQPIKEDLHLSDTQLGFLTGLAFALFYAMLGVPVARLSDRLNRVTITSIAIALWGVTVMACIGVRTFAQLVAARVAAAVGEAGGMPPTYSLLGDYFPRPADRVRAMSIYLLSGPFAVLISFMLGGWINSQYGWRATFFILGLPGLLMAPLVKMTVKDPRSSEMAEIHARVGVPRFASVLRTLWAQRSARHLSIGIILLFTLGFGLAPWYGAFLMRTHGMSSTQLGLWMGLILGTGGLVGIWGGGHLSARWLANDERSQMRLSALTLIALVPLSILFLLAPQRHWALLAFVPLVTLFNIFSAPAFSLLQRLVTDDMRATTLAVVMLLVNLIGMGVGPQLVGILSDAFTPRFGADSLRYAMLVTSWLALWAAYHFWRSAATVSQDLASRAS